MTERDGKPLDLADVTWLAVRTDEWDVVYEYHPRWYHRLLRPFRLLTAWLSERVF